MQIYYTIFDRDYDRVGFATSKQFGEEYSTDFNLASMGLTLDAFYA